MIRSPVRCPVSTTKKKSWPYDEYYIGGKDEEKRRCGDGENHWTGAESIEWYTGNFVRDTMHGRGDYRWRYRGIEGVFVTYEGYFYANRMHGYGTMSYPDGTVFTGLYHNNVRWGPGVETHMNLQTDVGFWRGKQLVRLTWRPEVPSLAPDLEAAETGKDVVQPNRVTLARNREVVGETNSALDLIKKYEADPLRAMELWPKLYSKHCSDVDSQACHLDAFKQDYYGDTIDSLEVVASIPDPVTISDKDSPAQSADDDQVYFFAWNNNRTMVHMMKHSYMHDQQRIEIQLNLEKILNGPRKSFRPPAKHERDCRTLLMACFTGHIKIVTRLINEHNIHPDLSDDRGNSALIYATCGDQPHIVHFLVEAGANVNSYNDSCCTPLGVALIRYICAHKDILPNVMIEALVPKKQKTLEPEVDKHGDDGKESHDHETQAHSDHPQNVDTPKCHKIAEWLINRRLQAEEFHIKPKGKSPTKNSLHSRTKSSLHSKTKSSLNSSAKSPLNSPTKSTLLEAMHSPPEPTYESDDPTSVNNSRYDTIKREYYSIVNNIFMGPYLQTPYVFEVDDMVKKIDGIHNIDTNKASNKDATVGETDDNKAVLYDSPTNSFDKLKETRLSKILLTLLQLLSDGADLNLVQCPQPGLLMATIAGCSELINHLVRLGADVNQKFPLANNYTALEIAVSRPLSLHNVEFIQTLLNLGADASHRLPYRDAPGPTLLHYILQKKVTSPLERTIRDRIVEILVEHNCSPTAMFKGQTPMEIIMELKELDLFTTIIKNPKIQLNDIINDSDQTILVKMFFLPYFKKNLKNIDHYPLLTTMMHNGADPLLECQNGNEKYANLFVFTKKTLSSMAGSKSVSKKSMMNLKRKSIDKTAKSLSSQKSMKSAKSLGKMDAAAGDYSLAVGVVTEGARRSHVTWLQAKLMRKLVAIIYKFKHRSWTMTLKEHDDPKPIGLWLTPQRCLAIWKVLKTTNRKVYKDEIVKKHLLYIVKFLNMRTKHLESSTCNIKITMTAAEKDKVELDVAKLLLRYKLFEGIDEVDAWIVSPELADKADKKFNICLECALPLEEDNNIPCLFCKIVAFCSFHCMELNIDRVGCHPCSEFLREKYFSVTPTNGTPILTSTLST